MSSVKSILGIDLRVASVKLVEIQKLKQGFTLVSSAQAEVSPHLLHKHPELEDAKAAALQKLVQEAKVKTRAAVVVVGGTDTLVKLYTLRSLPAGEVAEAIKWKFAEEIPYPAEEAIIDYYPLPANNLNSERIDYMAACIRRKLFSEIKYMIEKAGLKLIGITVLPDALLEVFREEIAKPGNKITSVVYMGNRTTNISIFRSGSFEFNREMNIGGENITQAMTGILVSPEGRIEITPEQAEKIKTQFGVPVDLDKYPKLPEIPLSQLQAMVRPALEKIKSEITRTFEYYQGQSGESAISQIILTGGSANTRNLKQYISDALGVPVNVPELELKLDHRLSGALGAAMVGTEKINLLPRELKETWKPFFDRLTKSRILLPLLLSCLLLFSVGLWLWALTLQNESSWIDRTLKEYKPRLEQLVKLEKTAEKEREREAALKAYEGQRQRFPKLLEEISRITPPSISLEIMQAAGNEMRLWGLVFGKNAAPESNLSSFVLKLSDSPLFKEVQLVQAQKNNDFLVETFRFEISAEVKAD